jgi:hypothetical protein
MDTVREGMRRVVHGEKGTARNYPDGSSRWALTNPSGEPEIQIGGKTGTAEIGEADENGVYDRQHAWFTCFAPFDEPEIAVAILVEDGGEGSAYDGAGGGPGSFATWFEISDDASGGLGLRPRMPIPVNSADLCWRGPRHSRRPGRLRRERSPGMAWSRRPWAARMFNLDPLRSIRRRASWCLDHRRRLLPATKPSASRAQSGSTSRSKRRGATFKARFRAG